MGIRKAAFSKQMFDRNKLLVQGGCRNDAYKGGKSLFTIPFLVKTLRYLLKPEKKKFQDRLKKKYNNKRICDILGKVNNKIAKKMKNASMQKLKNFQLRQLVFYFYIDYFRFTQTNVAKICIEIAS